MFAITLNELFQISILSFFEILQMDEMEFDVLKKDENYCLKYIKVPHIVEC